MLAGCRHSSCRSAAVAIMGAMPTPPPPLSSRLGDVRSSPVRDILELTQRPEVISFAGGLPAPELFPAELIADAFARTLAPTDRKSTRLNSSHGYISYAVFCLNKKTRFSR